MPDRKKVTDNISFVLLLILSIIFLFPIYLVVINSFKSKFNIINDPFRLPNQETFAGLENYLNGIESSDLIVSLLRTLFITVFSVIAIVIFTSMTAWFIVRVKNKVNKLIYYFFVFSMIVPFQMVMFTLTAVSSKLELNNLFGIIPVYLGFGSGLSVFMFSGFVKSLPREIEEAAMIDGCGPIKMFFYVIFPILKPTAITVAILNAMWIWNDYLLPYLVLDIREYRTIPIHIQYLNGSYGQVDLGAMMALIVLSIVPIVIFYFSCQKHIIKGIMAGAVKG